MAEFLTTKGTAFKLEEIIKGAESELILVSPYLQISNQFKERLKDAADRGVKIKLVYGKEKKLKGDQLAILSDIDNLELWYLSNLHAKCYLNETSMVITSMNFYSHSEENNREMGVFFEKTNDTFVFEKAISEIHSIIKHSELQPLVTHNKETQTSHVFSKNRNHKGFCIRCHKELKFNPSQPYCRQCEKEWNFWQNTSYEEKYCHNCGLESKTTIIKPQCEECFNKNHKVSDLINPSM